MLLPLAGCFGYLSSMVNGVGRVCPVPSLITKIYAYGMDAVVSATLLLEFNKFPDEKALIGEMLLAYAELEIVLFDILNAVIGNAQSTVRTLYRLRSESSRQNLVEAIVTPWFEKANLENELQEAMTATGHCRKIRNQYAHCQFISDEAILRFANLEVTAKSKGKTCQVVASPITLNLLKRQRAYFDYAHHFLLWLDHAYRTKNGKPSAVVGQIPKPKRCSPPKLNSRGEVHAI